MNEVKEMSKTKTTHTTKTKKTVADFYFFSLLNVLVTFWTDSTTLQFNGKLSLINKVFTLFFIYFSYFYKYSVLKTASILQFLLLNY